MAWFKFNQNNSSGLFIIDDTAGIGPVVWIEAATESDANKRAEGIGIYFDGCADGRDCPCCGDRWCGADAYDMQSSPVVLPQFDFGRHNTVYAHANDGSIHRLRQSDLKAASIPVAIPNDH